MRQGPPTPPRTWHRRTGGQLKTGASTIKADLEPLSELRVFGHAQWRKDCVNVSSELAQDRRAWSASARDVDNLIGDAGSIRPGWISTQVQVSKVPMRRLQLWRCSTIKTRCCNVRITLRPRNLLLSWCGACLCGMKLTIGQKCKLRRYLSL